MAEVIEGHLECPRLLVGDGRTLVFVERIAVTTTCVTLQFVVRVDRGAPGDWESVFAMLSCAFAPADSDAPGPRIGVLQDAQPRPLAVDHAELPGRGDEQGPYLIRISAAIDADVDATVTFAWAEHASEGSTTLSADELARARERCLPIWEDPEEPVRPS